MQSRSGSEIEFDLSGTVQLIKALQKLDKSPQKAVTKGAREGIKPVLKAIKHGTVPVGKTKNLRKALKRKAEKSRQKGKKVYEVTFDKKYNELLQKQIKNPGLLGGKGQYAYYPSSIEYGFLVRKKGESKGHYYLKREKGSNQHSEKLGIGYKLPSRKVQGQHFMREGAENARAQSQEAIIKAMNEMLEQLIKEASHQ